MANPSAENSPSWDTISLSPEYMTAPTEVRDQLAEDWIGRKRAKFADKGAFADVNALADFEQWAADKTGRVFNPETFKPLDEGFTAVQTRNVSDLSRVVGEANDPATFQTLRDNSPAEYHQAVISQLANPQVALNDAEYMNRVNSLAADSREKAYYLARRKELRDIALGTLVDELQSDGRLPQYAGAVQKNEAFYDDPVNAYRFAKSADGTWQPKASPQGPIDTTLAAVTGMNPSKALQRGQGFLGTLGEIGGDIGAALTEGPDKAAGNAIADLQKKYGLDDKTMQEVADILPSALLPDDVSILGKLDWDPESKLPKPFIAVRPDGEVKLSERALAAPKTQLDEMTEGLTPEQKEYAENINKLARANIYSKALPEMLNRDVLFREHFVDLANKPENKGRSREDLAIEAVDTYKRGGLRASLDALQAVSVEGMSELLASGLALAGMAGSDVAAEGAEKLMAYTAKEGQVRELLGQGALGSIIGDAAKLIPQVAATVLTGAAAGKLAGAAAAGGMGATVEGLALAGQAGGKAVRLLPGAAARAVAGAGGATDVAKLIANSASSAAFAASVGFSGINSAGLTFAGESNRLTEKYMGEGMDEATARAKARDEARLPALAAGVTTAAVTSLFGKGGFGGVEAAASNASKITLRDVLGRGPLSQTLRSSGFKQALATAAKSTGMGVAGEATEEATDELIQGITQIATTNPDMTLQQAVEGAMYAGLLGGLAGGGTAVVQRSTPADIMEYVANKEKSRAADTIRQKAQSLAEADSPESASVVAEVADAAAPVADPLAAVQGTPAIGTKASAEPKSNFGIPSDMSPMQKEYVSLRNTVPADMPVLLKAGDFYEVLGDDADIVAKTLGLTVTERKGAKMVGIPARNLDQSVKALAGAGLRVAVAEKEGTGPATIQRTTEPPISGQPEVPAIGTKVTFTAPSVFGEAATGEVVAVDEVTGKVTVSDGKTRHPNAKVQSVVGPAPAQEQVSAAPEAATQTPTTIPTTDEIQNRDLEDDGQKTPDEFAAGGRGGYPGERARQLAEDRRGLEKRLREAASYREIPDKAKWTFDFERKQLVSPDNTRALRFRIRNNPNDPAAYENQQTSTGVVVSMSPDAPITNELGVRTDAEDRHLGYIYRNLAKDRPVSAESVDAYGIALPDGYVKQGDLYVFRGTETPPPTTTPTTIPTTDESQDDQGDQRQAARQGREEVLTATSTEQPAAGVPITPVVEAPTPEATTTTVMEIPPRTENRGTRRAKIAEALGPKVQQQLDTTGTLSGLSDVGETVGDILLDRGVGRTPKKPLDMSGTLSGLADAGGGAGDVVIDREMAKENEPGRIVVEFLNDDHQSTALDLERLNTLRNKRDELTATWMERGITEAEYTSGISKLESDIARLEKSPSLTPSAIESLALAAESGVGGIDAFQIPQFEGAPARQPAVGSRKIAAKAFDNILQLAENELAKVEVLTRKPLRTPLPTPDTTSGLTDPGTTEGDAVKGLPRREAVFTDTEDPNNQEVLDALDKTVFRTADLFPGNIKHAPAETAGQRRADLKKAGVIAGKKQKVGDIIAAVRTSLAPHVAKVLDKMLPGMDLNATVDVGFADGMSNAALYSNGVVLVNRDAMSRAGGVFGDIVHELVHAQLKGIQMTPEANRTKAQNDAIKAIEKLRTDAGKAAKEIWGRGDTRDALAPRTDADRTVTEISRALSYAFGVAVDPAHQALADQSNPEEFFTMALQDPAVQWMLKKMDSTGKVPGAWSRFKRALAKMFGVTVADRSALDEALDKFLTIQSGRGIVPADTVTMAAPQGISPPETYERNARNLAESIVGTEPWSNDYRDRSAKAESIVRGRLEPVVKELQKRWPGLVYEVDSGQSSGVATTGAAGGAKITIGRDTLGLMTGADYPLDTAVAAISAVDEEIIHAIQILRMSEGTAPEALGGKMVGLSRSVWSEIVASVDAIADPEEQKRMKDAIVASWATYAGRNAGSAARQMSDNGQVVGFNDWNEVVDLADGKVPGVFGVREMMELTRQLVQMRQTGGMETQSWIDRLVAKLGEYFTAAVDALRGAVKDIPSLSPLLEDQISYIESTLAEVNAAIDQGKPLAAPQGISPQTVARHAELEAKHNAGTITPDEVTEAQGIVDQVARSQGGEKVWRGGDKFNVAAMSKPYIWLSEDEQYAATYGKTTPLFAFTKNSLDLRNLGEDSIYRMSRADMTSAFKKAGVSISEADINTSRMGGGEPLFRAFTTDEGKLKEAFVDAGYDGVRFYESRSLETPPAVTALVVFSPSQIKSAEPFTGVPLDQRFDTASPDIRYSFQGLPQTLKQVSLATADEMKTKYKGASGWIRDVLGLSPEGKVYKAQNTALAAAQRKIGGAEKKARKRKQQITDMLAKDETLRPAVEEAIGSFDTGLSPDQVSALKAERDELITMARDDKSLTGTERSDMIAAINRDMDDKAAATVAENLIVARDKQALAFTRLQKLNPELAKLVDEQNKDVTRLSMELRSLLPAGHGVAAAIDKNAGLYLTVSYAYHTDPQARRRYFGLEGGPPMSEEAKKVWSAARKAVRPQLRERMATAILREHKVNLINDLAAEIVQSGMGSPDVWFDLAKEELTSRQRDIRKAVRALAKENFGEDWKLATREDKGVALEEARLMLMEMEPDLPFPLERDEALRTVDTIIESDQSILDTEVTRFLTKDSFEAASSVNSESSDAIFKQRKQIPRWLADLWGRNESRLDAAFESMLKQTTSLARYHAMSQVLDVLRASGLVYDRGAATTQTEAAKPWLYVMPPEPENRMLSVGRNAARAFSGEQAVSLSELDNGTLGAWRGKNWVVPKSIADVLNEGFIDNKEEMGSFMRLFTNLTRLAMAGKTVGSVRAVPRNFLGNLAMFASAGGVDGKAFTRMPKALRLTLSDLDAELSELKNVPDPFVALAKQVARRFGEKPTPETLAYLEDAVKYGVLGASFFPEMLKALRTSAAKTANKANGQQGLAGLGKQKFEDWMTARSDIYQAADMPFRILLWEQGIDMVLRVQGLTRETADARQLENAKEQASKRLLSEMPTYQEGGKLAEMVKRQPVLAPFISFTMARLSNVRNTAKRNVNMLAATVKPVEQSDGTVMYTLVGKNDKPLFGLEFATREQADAARGRTVAEGVKSMSQFVLTQGITVAAATGIVQMFAAMIGAADDDLADNDEELRALAPEYARNNTILWTDLLRDENGVPKEAGYYDLSYLMPDELIVASAIRAAINEYALSGSVGKAAGAAVLQEFSPFTSRQLFLSSLLEAHQGRDENGKEIWSPGDSGIGKFMSGTGHVFGATLPADIELGKRLFKALRGEEEAGYVYDLEDEVKGMLTGTKRRTLRLDRAMEKSVARVAATKLAPANNGFAKDMKVDKTLDREDVIERYNNRADIFDSGVKELRQLLSVAENLGMSRQTVVKAMEESNVRGDVINAVAFKRPGTTLAISQVTVDNVNEVARKRRTKGEEIDRVKVIKEAMKARKERLKREAEEEQ